MKTITSKIIALAIVMSGIIFSDSSYAACNKPTGLNTSAITASSATLNWNAVSGALNYNIRYRVVSTSTWTNVTAITATSTTISSLTASANYEWQAQTRCSATQTSAWTTSVTFTTLVSCPVPTGLSVTGITATDATLNWAAVSGAQGYNIQYRIVGEPSWTATTSSSNSATITSLTPSSNYEVQVQSNCGGSDLSAFSASATFSTLAPPCNIPTGLITSDISVDNAVIAWDAAPYAVGYNIQYRQVGAPSWSTFIEYGGETTITGLLPATAYEWQIQTDCGNSNTSSFSGSETFSTTSAPCTTPVSLSVMDLTTTSVTIKWEAVAGAVGYNIEYREAGAPSWTVTSTTSTSVALSALTPSASYEWQVQTDCGSSNFSAFSAVNSFATLTPVCIEPYDLNVTNVMDNSVTLIWAEQRTQFGYNVQYREVGASTWNTLNSTTNSVAISSLNPATGYEFQVQTNCGNSNLSVFTASLLFGTATPVTCTDVPASITATNVTHDAATLSWVSGANEAMASGYEVQYRELNTSSWNTVTSSSTSVGISSLNIGTDYEWQVRRSCGVSYSAFSSMGTFTTLSHVAPGNVSQNISSIPNLNDPSTWNVIFVSTGDPNTDAQIVHDWLLTHGIIKE